MGLQKLYAKRWIFVFENALVKISGSVANIIYFADMRVNRPYSYSQ